MPALTRSVLPSDAIVVAGGVLAEGIPIRVVSAEAAAAEPVSVDPVLVDDVCVPATGVSPAGKSSAAAGARTPPPPPPPRDVGASETGRELGRRVGRGERGLARAAWALRHRAARGERAAGRAIDSRRRVSADARQPLDARPVGAGQRAEQADRVRHARAVEDGVRLSPLDDAAGVHDGDPVGDAGDDAEVVGDEEEGRAALVPGRVEYLEHLRLDGHVEGGGRLVGDDDVGLVGDGHRDHRALAHAARQLVRERVHAARGVGDADEVEELDGARRRRRRGGVAVHADRLDDLAPDREHRCQRRQRVLEDHRDRLAAKARHRPVVETDQLPPVQPDRATDGRRLAGAAP